jgi:hypothetical protein
MTPREYDILRALRYMHFAAEREERESRFVRPMDIGAMDGSHHSITLRRMAKPAKGWVEIQPRGGQDQLRESKLYAITPKGMLALSNHVLTLNMATSAAPHEKKPISQPAG